MISFDIATGSVRADGAWRLKDDGFSGAAPAHPSPGVYEMTLFDPIPVSECCPVVSPWRASGDPPAARSATVTLLADLVTLRVETFDLAGAPADSAFCVIVRQVMA